MSINRPDEDNGSRFNNPLLREFDAMLDMLPPGKRAGYLDSVYARCMKGNFDADYVRELAQLLIKRSTDKHQFASHAEKLLKKDSNAIPGEQANIKKMMEEVFAEGAADAADVAGGAQM